MSQRPRLLDPAGARRSVGRGILFTLLAFAALVFVDFLVWSRNASAPSLVRQPVAGGTQVLAGATGVIKVAGGLTGGLGEGQ